MDVDQEDPIAAAPSKGEQDDDEGLTETVCRTIRGLKAHQAELRSAVDRRSITLRKKGKLLESLQAQLAPEEGLIRQYLKTVYETDRDLVETLTVAKQRLTAMDRAVERHVVVGEVLRYAHVVRPITSAPDGWNERIPWIPRDPFKPSNLYFAPSRLRKYQTEMEEKKRERERAAKAGEHEEPPAAPAVLSSRDTTAAEVISQYSHSTEFEPPPGWKPGQPIDIRPDVVARIRSQVEVEEEHKRKRGMSVASEGEAGVKKVEAPQQPQKRALSPPRPQQPPPPPQHVAKKPKKQTFMDDDDEDEEEEDEED